MNIRGCEISLKHYHQQQKSLNSFFLRLLVGGYFSHLKLSLSLFSLSLSLHHINWINWIFIYLSDYYLYILKLELNTHTHRLTKESREEKWALFFVCICIHCWNHSNLKKKKSFVVLRLKKKRRRKEHHNHNNNNNKRTKSTSNFNFIANNCICNYICYNLSFLLVLRFLLSHSLLK